ncbi:MAG: hypothetical protein RLZZ308_219 [Candidatus Parcubacteria bacterium]
MKTEILARVSTLEQKEAGNSLPAQQARLISYIERSFSKTNGSKLILDKEFIFDETAFKEHRKEFEKVIEYILSLKEVVALCCDKVDRLTRDFLVGLPMLEKLRREGKIELHFPSDNLVLHQNSPATDLFHFNIAVSLAQYYSNAISDNTKRAFEQKRRKGEWTGKPPIGYKNFTDIDGNKTIQLDTERAHLIAKIFELYATGNHSMESIREQITNEGLRSINGYKLSKSSIENILKETFYYGQPFSNKYGLFPTYHNYGNIIAKDLYDRCQEVRTKKKKTPYKAVSKEYIFKGVLKCEKCGCTMTPETKTKKSGLVFTYYSCTNSKGICKRVYVSENDLLEPILADLERLSSLTEDIQNRLVEGLRKTTEAEVVFHKAQIQRIRTEHDKLATRKDGLVDALIDKSITKEIYDKKLQDVSDKEQLLAIELEEHLQADTDYKTTIATVMSVARRSIDIFNSSEPHEKRALLNYLLQNPSVNEKTLVYTMRSPFNLMLSLDDRPIGLRE